MSKTTFLPGVSPYNFKQAITNLAREYDRTFSDKPNGSQDKSSTDQSIEPKPVKSLSSLTDAEWSGLGYGEEA